MRKTRTEQTSPNLHKARLLYQSFGWPNCNKSCKALRTMEDRITSHRGGLSFSSTQLLIIVRALILLSPKRNFVRLSLHPLVITITSLGTICYRFHLPSHLSSSPTLPLPKCGLGPLECVGGYVQIKYLGYSLYIAL